MVTYIRLSVACSTLALGLTSSFAYTSITFIPGRSANTFTQVTSISSDGSIVTGRSGSSAYETWTWTASGGRVDVPTNSGIDYQVITQVSSDGSAFVGTYGLNGIIRRNGLQDTTIFRPLGYSEVSTYSISSNGQSVSASLVQNGIRTRAAFWDRGSGYTLLPNLNASSNYAEPLAISGNGNIIVGLAGSQPRPVDDPVSDGVVWTRSGTITLLSGLNPDYLASRGFATSFDGSIIVGDSYNRNGWTEACYWNAAREVVGLGILPGFGNSLARATDAMGEIIGGRSQLGQYSTAFIWTPEEGMVVAADYLRARGVQIPAGWNLREVNAISADGLTFGGIASSATTPNTAWVATIPTPGPLVGLGIAAIFAHRRRRRE